MGGLIKYSPPFTQSGPNSTGSGGKPFTLQMAPFEDGGTAPPSHPRPFTYQINEDAGTAPNVFHQWDPGFGQSGFGTWNPNGGTQLQDPFLNQEMNQFYAQDQSWLAGILAILGEENSGSGAQGPASLTDRYPNAY